MYLKSFKIRLFFCVLIAFILLTLLQNNTPAEKRPTLFMDQQLIEKNCSVIANVFGKKKKEMRKLLHSIAPFEPIIADLNVVGCLMGENCFEIVKSGQLRLGLTPKQWKLFRQIHIISDRWKFGENSTFCKIREFTVFLSRMESKTSWTYWLISSDNHFNLTEIRIPFSSAISLTDSCALTAHLSVLKLLAYQLQHSRFVHCRRDLELEIKQTHPQLYWDKNVVIRSSHVKTLQIFVDFMYFLELHPFMAAATLLGWYRECGFIPHTTDVDFFVDSHEMTKTKETWVKNIEKVLLFCSFVDTFGVLEEDYQELYEFAVSCNDIKTDVFAFYNDGNISWCGGSDGKEKLRWIYPYSAGDDICTADLLGHLFFVPCEVESRLEATYGKEWYKVHHTKNYDWKKSPKNTEFVGLWS